ncbi:hypothetical protein FXV77_10605 [Sphingobacterium phlebotomi]|uniref:Prepilin type IV endopeptidase peptidase domain-containing protein n=1 Tax=Sphingobacterium phlebotomi TaxID=2605433 RepID=A0A5D4HC10_9SPHI|nr:hypothetical protein [Sphingobacterium phlebotomi]TYR36350.1 hypothetical protein FXV77_10605 [Sphingobacterium phlebotomi]
MIWFVIAMIGACGIALEDFKWRMVHIWWYLVLSVGLGGLSIALKGTMDTLSMVIWNVGFILLLLLILTVYLSLKERKLVFLFDRYLGWGDVFFFVCVALYLDLATYITFLIISLIAALIIAPVIFKWQGKDKHIPLAGIQAICLMLYLPMVHFDLFPLKLTING